MPFIYSNAGFKNNHLLEHNWLIYSNINNKFRRILRDLNQQSPYPSGKGFVFCSSNRSDSPRGLAFLKIPQPKYEPFPLRGPQDFFISSAQASLAAAYKKTLLPGAEGFGFCSSNRTRTCIYGLGNRYSIP